MHSNRIVRDRVSMEVELRRAGGYRAVAALAVLGLVTMIGVGSLPDSGNRGALGLHTESYDFSTPAATGMEYREVVAVAPATGVYEEPDLVVQHEVHG